MRRIILLVGMIIWTVACVVWSYFTSAQNDGYVVVHSLWTVPVWLYLGGIIIGYGLCWINAIQEWNRRPVFLFGKYKETRGPGLALIEPLFHTVGDDVMVCDQVVQIISKEAIQTKDNVGIILKGILTYCINENEVRNAVVNVEDVDVAIIERAGSTLADEGAKHELPELLEQRDTFCETIKNKLTERVNGWGATIKAFELKSFQISDEETAKAIALKARAQKEGEAELARANMQKQVAEALNAAADTLTENGRWLKGIETLLELSRSAQNNTVLIPTDLTNSLANIFAKKP